MSAGLAALRAAIGSEAVSEHEPFVIEGAKLEATLRPTSAEMLAETLRVASETAHGVLIRGGGTSLEAANAPCRAIWLLETTGIAGEAEIDLEEGVAHLPAGRSLASLHAELAGTGWELPFDAPGSGAATADAPSGLSDAETEETSGVEPDLDAGGGTPAETGTLGGAIASAAQGPRFGSPRDFVLGLQLALANGDRVKCGGRVVKNVTGYDLNKLFTGSFGTLGVIESAWIRLRPAPEQVRHLSWSLAEGDEGGAAALAAARRPTARVAAFVQEGARRTLTLELAGDAPAVEADAEVLRARGAVVADVSRTARVRSAQGTGPFRVRIHAMPSRVSDVAGSLAAAGARIVAYPARGIIWAVFAIGPDAEAVAVGRAHRAAKLASQAGGGPFAVEAGPWTTRRGIKAYGESGATRPIQRAIKAQYDPAGILNPGRGVGGE